jgi:hypothetical protein
MNVAQFLRATGECLTGRWIKHQTIDENGNVCLVQAMRLVAAQHGIVDTFGGNDLHSDAAVWLAGVVLGHGCDRSMAVTYLVAWNDTYSVTETDVRETLNKAALAWEAAQMPAPMPTPSPLETEEAFVTA